MTAPGRRTTRRHLLAAAVVACTGLLVAACGSGSDGSAPTAAKAAATGSAAPATSATVPVKIGYFPNLTHAPGLVADAEGFLTRRIGAGKVTTQSFNAGPDVIQALFSGSLDIAYVGPNPTITAYAQSQGAAVRVIAGAASGGAALVVKPSITSPEQLRGATLATPQLGNTQDVALRYWLSTKGFKTTTEGGGDVKIQPQKNAAALQAYASGQLDGAWVPEPYATQFVAKGAHVLVDEKSLWPDGKFVTTNIVARTDFLAQHPETVRAFLEADLDAIALITKDPAKAQQDVITQIAKLTGQTLKADTVAASWKNLTFTADPLAASLKQSAEHAATVGLLPNKPGDGFAKLWDLSVLNAALKSRGESEVTS
jgi:NitT/TauT family transport system substrate-binding protein